MTNLFNKGDKVIIKKLPVKQAEYREGIGYDGYFYPGTGQQSMSYQHDMQKMAGQVHTISIVQRLKYGSTYRLQGDKDQWSWTDEFLLPVSNKAGASLLVKLDN